MANYISHMPLWAIVLFIISFLYSIRYIANPAKQAALDTGFPLQKANNIRVAIFGFYILYLAYVSVVALQGVFDVSSLPPKVMIWGGIPLLIILFGFVGNTNLFKTLLRSIKLELLVALHIFRLVGVFFILLYLYHRLPAAFAFSAGLGDIATALLALPVAGLVSKRKPGWITAVYAWNILGMLDIINLLVIAVVYTRDPGAAARRDLEEMTVFPFVWFPAFAPATILFLHTAVFRKLKQIRK